MGLRRQNSNIQRDPSRGSNANDPKSADAGSGDTSRIGSEPRSFFSKDHFVSNYCPLAFLEESGRNFTQDKLPAETAKQLQRYCDAHLMAVIKSLKPDWLIGVGSFAKKRAAVALENESIQIAQILHPSPASPAANRGWAEQAQKQLLELGVWTSESPRVPR